MTGKRTLKVAGEKIARERASLKLDQESFARTANVSVRTLQRAEKSGMISRAKINQIAKVLEINPEELLDDDVSEKSLDARNDGHGTLILEPVQSYKELWKLLTGSLEWLDVKYDISPNPDLIEKVADVIKTIQVRINDDRSGITEAMQTTGEPPDYVQQFKKDMEITKSLLDLWNGGISVFAGQYTFRSLILCNDKLSDDDPDPVGYWKPEAETFAVLRFLDDKDIARKKDISISVHYGISKHVENKWQFREGTVITRDFLRQVITADNQISSNAVPGNMIDTIPF